MSDYYVREEDGTSHFLLEDGSGALIEEGGEVDPSFIASATTVYAPTLVYTGQQNIVTGAGTFQWLCPAGITLVYVECIAGAASGYSNTANGTGKGGGGGGAYAARVAVPVTPGTLYTFTVGAGGVVANPGGNAGGDSTFTGDGGVQVVAKGGSIGGDPTGGQGGQAAGSTGDVGHVFSGGAGGNGPGGLGSSAGGGGGASGNRLAAGNQGGNSTAVVPGSGGSGANGGGSGGLGQTSSVPGVAGTSPGGGGGGGGGFGGFNPGGAGADGSVRITAFAVSFIASVTAVYPPAIVGQEAVPFIGSVTTVYAPTLSHLTNGVGVPYIASRTRVFGVWDLFNPNWTGVGPGNGGETFPIRLAPNGVTETATLAAGITATDLLVQLTGDGGFPTNEPFVATIGSEVIYLFPLGGGSYSVRKRAMSNTTAATHTAGASVSWGDSYELSIVAGDAIAHSFTADINSTGSFIYDGWLICFDSSQAYLAGGRYPMHVTEMLGVFDAGAGSGGSSRCDGPQPNAVCTPTGISDACPAALTNPALITTDIRTGDIAVVRYTNPEATVLDLGPRSVALKSWFGLKRVNSTDSDVTLTDPDGYVVDTIPSGPGPGPFTGSVNHEWADPVPLAIGIAPDSSDAAGMPIPTPNPVPWTTVTLPGADRYFTDSIHYSEKGWPVGCLAVRQGNRRVPHWQSWDWHDYSYVYTGFGTDDTFCQLLINRNGIVFDSLPVVELPGTQDIDGPDAVWDDGTYYMAASWYVVLFGAPYIVSGPIIGGGPGTGEAGNGFAPVVGFPGGTSGGPGPPGITTPPTIEGGGGGDITPPPGGVLAWTKQGH